MNKKNLGVTFGSPNINVTGQMIKNISDILDSGWVSIGRYMEKLEQHFREEFHVKHAIATSCATTGLIIAVRAAGWNGETVALPAFTWPSTLYALECNSCKPCFVDIDKGSWLGVYSLKNDRNHIVVDIFGNQAGIFEGNNVIIDAAHSYGLPGLGKRGLAEVVSLSFTKVVTATEGGIILTDNDELAERATELRRLSGRMEEINALIALHSIKNYKPELTQSVIDKYIYDINVEYTCQEMPFATNNSVFSILFENKEKRDSIRSALSGAGVETKVYYEPLYRGLRNTEYVFDRILSLPIHSGVIPVQDKIISIINNSVRMNKEFKIDGVVVDDGQWGIKWKKYNKPYNNIDNPAMFTCKLCGKVSAGRESAHYNDCTHPYKGQ